MHPALENLEPEAVWRHFGEFAIRPRPSGEEKAVREYVLQWATQLGFSTRVDSVGNTVVYVPGRGKGEHSPPVILQGHLDMVCEKNTHVEHDFSTDPIALRRIGERICANETTLGADNGIGVALCLAMAEGFAVHHPPLEILLTVDEETGMTGARQLDASMLSARRMINLDAEEEGVLYVGCAGGLDTIATLSGERKFSGAGQSMELRLRGLRGGHSGLDIGLNRGNAIRLMAQVIRELGEDIQLVSFIGGLKRNAIPREATTRIQWVSERSPEDRLGLIAERLRALHGDSEETLQLEWERVADERGPLTEESRSQLIDFLFLLPAGVATLSQTIPGLVETSNNLGVLEMEGDTFRAVCCSRSSNEEALRQLTSQITGIATRCGWAWEHHGGYPGWQPNRRSSILATAQTVFRELAGGVAPEVTAIHAGLECGLLGSVLPGLDMVAFGPDIQDAHSPDESVSIPSVAVVANQVSALLERLC